jgi:hypothetical protein
MTPEIKQALEILAEASRNVPRGKYRNMLHNAIEYLVVMHSVSKSDLFEMFPVLAFYL